MRTTRQAYLDRERAKWLSPREAAYVLGVSTIIIWRRLRDGSLPYQGQGKNRRIHMDSLTRHQQEASVKRPVSVASVPVSRPPAQLSHTSRRLRAFEGGRPLHKEVAR